MSILWILHHEPIPDAVGERLRAVLTTTRAVPRASVEPMLRGIEHAIRETVRSLAVGHHAHPRRHSEQRNELAVFRNAIWEAMTGIGNAGRALSPDALARIETERTGKRVDRREMMAGQRETIWPDQGSDAVFKALGGLWTSVLDAEATLAKERPRSGRHPDAAVRELVARLGVVWRDGVGRYPSRKPGGPFVRLALEAMKIAHLRCAPDTVIAHVRALSKVGRNRTT